MRYGCALNSGVILGLLQTPDPTITLVHLLLDPDHFNQFLTIRLLSLLLSNRPAPLQKHFLTSRDAAPSVVSLLDIPRDMTRTEALQMILALVQGNADIQKILAFEGVFERLFKIIVEEQGIEGSVVAQECLVLIDALLRYNVSNQNYFRELGLPAQLPQLLHFPTTVPRPDQPLPQNFNLQIWSNAKWESAAYVIGIMGILSKSKGANIQVGS